MCFSFNLIQWKFNSILKSEMQIISRLEKINTIIVVCVGPKTCLYCIFLYLRLNMCCYVLKCLQGTSASEIESARAHSYIAQLLLGTCYVYMIRKLAHRWKVGVAIYKILLPQLIKRLSRTWNDLDYSRLTVFSLTPHICSATTQQLWRGVLIIPLVVAWGAIFTMGDASASGSLSRSPYKI